VRGKLARAGIYRECRPRRMCTEESVQRNYAFYSYTMMSSLCPSKLLGKGSTALVWNSDADWKQNGMVAVELTPSAEALEGVQEGVVGIDITAAVRATPDGLGVGCLTAFWLALEADKFADATFPGRMDTLQEVFGEAGEVDYTHPCVKEGAAGVHELWRELIPVEAGSMVREQHTKSAGSKLGTPGHLRWSRPSLSKHRWVLCIVYNWDGCAAGTLRVAGTMRERSSSEEHNSREDCCL
jgi:hypothetical protein